MREPQPGRPWSIGRARARAVYADYMDSPAWWARRRAWQAAWTDRHGTRPACQACGQPWTLLHGDLHHATYTRLGRAAATAGIIATLQRLHRANEDAADPDVIGGLW